MKIRSQFISNSSSTSYIIFGIESDYNTLRKLYCDGKDRPKSTIDGCLHEFDRSKQKFCEECGQPAFRVKEAGEWSSWELQEKIQQHSGLKISVQPIRDVYAEYSLWVGISINGFDYKAFSYTKPQAVSDYINEIFNDTAAFHFVTDKC